MTGTAVTFGATYAARVYFPLNEALLNPKLFIAVSDRLRAGDSIRLFYTDKGHKAERVLEMVDLVVRGFSEREPRLFQTGPVFRMEDVVKAEPLTEEPQAPAAPADPRTGLRIERRESGQGRGKPKLISWDVYDGVGAVIFSDNDEEVAKTFVRDFGKAA